MHFNAGVKSDTTGRLKGNYQCETAPDGLRLMRKKAVVVTLPRGGHATHVRANVVSAAMPGGGTVEVAVSRFGLYQGRLAGAVAAFLRGERDLADEREFKVELYLLIPAVLPFGILLVTRGGAIWGALGGVVAVGCLTLAQVESMPRAARLALILLINAAMYGGVVAMMASMQAA